MTQGREYTDDEKVHEALTSVKNMIVFASAYTAIGADMSLYYRIARTLRGLDSCERVAGHNLQHNKLCAEWRPL